MAVGFLRALAGERFEVASAETEATRVHPLAMRVMVEVGIDLSGQASKTVDRLLDQPRDYVITVCDGANEASRILAASLVPLERGTVCTARHPAG
jgi:arsenate reductase